MSSEIATYERVRDVVETMRKRSVAPTADRVIAMIGGGSKSTVLAHLKRLRDAPLDDDAIPPSVVDAARGALNEIYLAGRAAEANTARAATDRLALVVREQDAQITELADKNDRLEWSKAQLVKQLVAIRSDLENAVERSAKLDLTIDGLRVELATERQKGQEKVQDALSRVERLLQRRPAATSDQTERKTLGLPSKSASRNN